MAEIELRAKEMESAASAVVAGEVKVPRLRWLIIGLIFLATLINYIDRLTVSVLAPVITEALKLSNLEYASLGTWFLLAYTISQGVSGRLYDQVGARRGFTLSITVWSLAAMAHAFARGLGSLSVFRFLLGLGEAGNWPGAAKVIAEWFPVRERAFAMSIFNSGAAIGSIVAPPIIVWLQLSYGWQTTFILTGALGFLWLALWLLWYQPPDRHPWMTDKELALIGDGATGRRGEGETTGIPLCRPIAPSPRRPVAEVARPAAVQTSMGHRSRASAGRSGLVAVHYVAAAVPEQSSWLRFEEDRNVRLGTVRRG